VSASRFVERLRLDRHVREAVPVDGTRRAAVAAIVDERASPRVLLMKRAERVGDPWSGHISLPGGGYQPDDDPDLLATAIRETHEELGIALARDQLVGQLSPLSPRSTGPIPIEVTPFVFRPAIVIEPVCGPEADCAFWLPIELAMSGELDSTYTYPGSSMTFPSWTYEGHVIWGLTRRILDDLIAAARARDER
jgi:8-oxo-dGTP pyrophosphatase MutT (NUDIX family)